MWERFSYYGMRALLILFMTKAAEQGGLGIDPKSAGAIYGLYTGCVYLMALPGGWIADQLIGQRKAVFYGGILIASGHLTMALPNLTAFYVGLSLIVVGTGLLKPNISAIVGQLYKDDTGARRDAGFSIFYMGINLGAFMAPLVTGALQAKFNYHVAFGACGVAMVLGLINYKITEKSLEEAGLAVARTTPESRKTGWVQLGAGLIALFGIIAGTYAFMKASGVEVSNSNITYATLIWEVVFAVGFFTYIMGFAGLTAIEVKKVAVIAVFFVAAAFFWGGFEQAGSTFNFFADRYTELTVFGYAYPAAWFQSVNAIYIVILAPFFASLWVHLAKRNWDTSSPAKFAIALLQVGIGFAVIMAGAQAVVASGGKVGPQWLLMTYLIHTTAELCLSPVGLSNVTKLSPPRFVGQMMGIWFLGASIGNIAAGLMGGHMGSEDAATMPAFFQQLVWVYLLAGGVLLLFAKKIHAWTNEDRKVLI
jgi:POT family proton-dependent oligopeptide transporter